MSHDVHIFNILSLETHNSMILLLGSFCSWDFVKIQALVSEGLQFKITWQVFVSVL